MSGGAPDPASFSLDDQRRWNLAQDLNEVIKRCLAALKVEAQISLLRLFDVVQRWERDAVRLGKEQKAGFHPVKYIAYQAFWIRKLKPVSNAYRRSDLERAKAAGVTIDPFHEVLDINERLAIHVAIKNLLRYAEDGLYPSELAGNTIGETAVKHEVLRDYLNAYLCFPCSIDAASTAVGGAGKGTTYDNIIYNQRYRTFGPHHLVHILDQAIFGALRQQSLVKGQPGG